MMPIKQIILHQGRDKRSEDRLKAACAISKRHGSRIIGLSELTSADDQVRKVFEKHVTEKKACRGSGTLSKIET